MVTSSFRETEKFLSCPFNKIGLVLVGKKEWILGIHLLSATGVGLDDSWSRWSFLALVVIKSV